MSVRPSVMLCNVAKRYIIQQNCKVSEQVNKKCLPIGTRRYNFQPCTPAPTFRKLCTHPQNFQCSTIGYLSNSWASYTEDRRVLFLVIFDNGY